MPTSKGKAGSARTIRGTKNPAKQSGAKNITKKAR